MFGQQYFALNAQQSPTHYNLHQHLLGKGWRFSRFAWRAGFTSNNLCFNAAASEQLEYKHLLAELISQSCPAIMPLTFCIDDSNWQQVLEELPSHPVWILKPSLLNNGQHIKLFQAPEEIAKHYYSNQRMGGIHVLQQYINNPHLLRDQRKYSIRVFVLLTNYDGAYVYQQGYFNVARQPYSPDISDLRPHLTNEHLLEQESNVIQIPSLRFDFFTKQFEHIKHSLSLVLHSLKQRFPLVFTSAKTRHLAIFGFDFMADDAGKIWLLEANHGPCFPMQDNHPLQHFLYDNFWSDLIDSFVALIAKNSPLTQINYRGFDRIL